MMPNLSPEKSYPLYYRAGTNRGTLLTETEFHDFWNDLAQDEREYWAREFTVGTPTILSREVVTQLEHGFDAIDLGLAAASLDPALNLRIQQLANRHKCDRAQWPA